MIFSSLVIDLAIVELPATLGHANRFTDTEDNYVLPTPDEKQKKTNEICSPLKKGCLILCTGVLLSLYSGS